MVHGSEIIGQKFNSDHLQTFKTRLGGNRPYVSDDRTLQGRFLCQLLATS